MSTADIWVKSPLTAEALENHSVEFRFPLAAGGCVEGKGRFIAKSGNRELCVIIEVAYLNARPLLVINLPESAVHAIQPARPPAGAEFTCHL